MHMFTTVCSITCISYSWHTHTPVCLNADTCTSIIQNRETFKHTCMMCLVRLVAKGKARDMP